LPFSLRHGHGDAPPADRSARVEVTVRLRRRGGVAFTHRGGQLDHDGFAARFGADEEEIEAVCSLAHARGLEIVEVSPARRSVVLAGKLGVLADLFGADVRRVMIDGVRYRRRVGALHAPPELAGLVEAVFGFTDRPRARPGVVLAPRAATRAVAAGKRPIDPPEVARLYGFPEGFDGGGQTIALLEFGGGYRDADLDAYFRRLDVRRPEVLSVTVSGLGNVPGIHPRADAEVALDVQVAGAVAPGARIVVYFAEWTERGWVDALNAAIHDRVNQPSVISISWGWAELGKLGTLAFSEATMAAIDTALAEAAALGVTVLAASGDAGVADQIGDGGAHVDYPASSPYVLACGGTSPVFACGELADEEVWDEGAALGTSGGGVSAVHPLPAWQASAGVPASPATGKPGRGVPDVAGIAGGPCGYTLRIGGRDVAGVGGTSAVAPLYAGLVARLNQALGRRLGHLNALLYGSLAARGAVRDVVRGQNGSGSVAGFRAGAGWDPCTGLGSLRGTQLLDALREALDAGVPSSDASRPSHVTELRAPELDQVG
jgi:kumamolisin